MSALVIPAGDLGAIPVRDSLNFLFNTVNSSGVPTTITGGNVQARDLLTLTTFNTGVAWDLDVATGLHRVSIDASDDSVWIPNRNYVIELASGTVDFNAVAGSIVGQLSIAGRSAGLLYDQSVKVASGHVTGVGADPGRVFTGVFANASQTTNQYRSMVATFQPRKDGTGSANQGVGRAILKSEGAGVDTVTFTLEEPFASAIQVQDEFKILPEERALAGYTANITAEWGAQDPSPKDQYTILWSKDGTLIANPASVITNMRFHAYRRVFPGSDILIIDENLSADPVSGAYDWDETNNLIAANQGAIMKATATIDGIEHTFARTLYNYV